MSVSTVLSAIPVSHLHQDYAQQRELFEAQPLVTRLYLEQQARQIDEALLAHAPRVRFDLPDRIQPTGRTEPLTIPSASRRQVAGGWLPLRGLRSPTWDDAARKAFTHLLAELEHNPEPALSLAGTALRYAAATLMIHQLLPDGRAVTYVAAAGDEIPSLPVNDGRVARSALTAETDAIVEGEADRGGRVQVPFTPAAQRFFLPQWVAFDEDDRLLVNQVSEAEGYLASMQRYMEGLHHAVAIAPYMVADQAYQRKRAGMLGQLVNQGRALARFYTREIIATIQRRAREGDLNRGLDLGMPYFDDQQLKMRIHEMTIVPAGRIVFLPAFVVRAVRLEAGNVAQDTRMNPSTRKHLLAQFAMLEEKFLHFSPK